MARFFFVARENSGKKVTGFEDASTPEEVITRLQGRDLIVINVAAEYEDIKGLREGVASQQRKKFRHYGITGDDLVLFCRQLATLLSAGVTIMKCLEIISQQVASFRLFTVLKSLQKHMEGGLSLHEAMAKHPSIFSELWINLVESGEASGNLATVLSRLATYLERNAAFRNKVISATLYPGLLFLAATGALLFVTLKIIPTFAELFKGFNITLPLLTRILIAVSTFLRKFIIFLALAGGIGIFLFVKYARTKAGQGKVEQFQLRIPLLGELYRALVIERFSSEMSTLVESGVPILYSLEITEHSVGSPMLAEILRKIKEEVREGKSLSQPLAKCGFFDPMVVQMVTIGEEVGELSPMFKKINNFYQEYVETFLTRFTALFEPIMLIFMGGVVAVVVIGVFLPIFQISQIGG